MIAKLTLFTSAGALALLATAWSTHGAAAQSLYTPMPRTASQPAPYDAQHKSSASNSKSFSLYTPMPPAPADQAVQRNLAQAPDGQHGNKPLPSGM